MVELLYGWIKNIAFYLILITAVLNVLPDNSYKKYIRLFTGLVLILLLISPLAKLLKFEALLDFNLETESYRQELDNVQNNAKYFENVQTEYLTDAYGKEAKTRIEEIVRDYELYPVDIQVYIENDAGSENFGQIYQVDITASYTEDAGGISVDKITIGGENEKIDSYEQVNIKKEVENFYNVPVSNINISIQR